MEQVHRLQVIIPVYKPQLDEWEQRSVRRGIAVLSAWPLGWVYPEGMDMAYYRRAFPEIGHFYPVGREYLRSVSGYNRLLLQAAFYQLFAAYEYLLVYQPDCYIFRDELERWMQAEYDYVGGVWFENYLVQPGVEPRLSYPGNGGFSLRRVAAMQDILEDGRPFNRISTLGKAYVNNVRRGMPIHRVLVEFVKTLLYVVGWNNSPRSAARWWQVNEDRFFVDMAMVHGRLRIPSVEEAIDFCWDHAPGWLYARYGRLPMAAHAWYREDWIYAGNRKFWEDKLEEVLDV